MFLSTEYPNVFPLENLSTRWKNYFMTGAGTVISTCRKKDGLPLSGSKATPHAHRYVTLADSSWRLDQLVKRAKAHKAWTAETSAQKMLQPVKVVKPEPQVSKQSCMSAAIEGRQWVIASIPPGGDRLLFGTNPKVHYSEPDADAELSRLALVSPGIIFVKLQIKGAVRAGGIEYF